MGLCAGRSTLGRAGSAGCGYVYAGDRKAERPILHLSRFSGVLQVDGYSGYRALADRKDVKLAFCWARRFRSRRRALAIIASLVETCKLNGVDPQAYLTDVITRIVGNIPQSRLDDLLPWAYPIIPGLKAAA